MNKIGLLCGLTAGACGSAEASFDPGLEDPVWGNTAVGYEADTGVGPAGDQGGWDLITCDPDVNLVVNGDAEIGELVGWNYSLADAAAVVDRTDQADGIVEPARGGWMMSFADLPSSGGVLVQTGELPPHTGRWTLAAAVQTEARGAPNGDFGEVKLDWIDESGEVVGTFCSGALTTDSLVWNQALFSLYAPEDAVAWELRLHADLRYGRYVNVFFDEVSLACVP